MSFPVAQHRSHARGSRKSTNGVHHTPRSAIHTLLSTVHTHQPRCEVSSLYIFEYSKPPVRKPVFFLFSLFLCAGLFGQQVKRFSFTHHSTSAGLASNEVTTVTQDSSGYIWIGTNNGLQRFDGVRFLTFRSRKNDPTSLPFNSIIQLLYDRRNNLWVITADQKIGIFDTKRFKFHEARVRESDPAWLGRGKRLVEDDQGNLVLLFVYAGFVTWNEERREFAREYNFIPPPPDPGVVDVIHQPGTAKYWMGTASGMICFDRRSGQFSDTRGNTAHEKLIDERGSLPLPQNLMIDRSGRLWFDSWSGGVPLIYCYDLRNDRTVVNGYNLGGLTHGYIEVTGFLQQKDGTVWVKGLGVLARFLEQQKEFQVVYNGYENEQSIAYSRINNFFEDREENMWIATNTNGLYHFKPSAQFFTNIRQINRRTGMPGDGSMMSFIQLKNGDLLAGAWSDGLYRFDSNYTAKPLNIRGIDSGDFAWCLARSHDSDIIWMAAQPGFYKINERTGRAAFFNPPILQNKTVRQITEDRFGNLWLGTQSIGLYKWSASRQRNGFENGLRAFPGVPVTQITQITQDRDGMIWVGTSALGVYIIDPRTDKVIGAINTSQPPPFHIGWNGIASIFAYNDSLMAIGANGIYFYNRFSHKVTDSIPIPETIPALVSSMQRDEKGYLWVSTTNGILRLNPKNKMFIQFNRLDGIANDLFILGASLALPSGKLLFGADNQFVSFDPDQVRLNDPAPNVTITGFTLMNQPLSVDSLLAPGRIDLPAKDNSLTIEFSALNYSGAYAILYRMNGIDKSWIAADRSQQAVYTYLPPGKYTFLAKTEDVEGNPSPRVVSIDIVIRPPFWRTGWFIGLAVFALLGVLFWLDKLRLQKIRATESIRTRIAESLTEDMTNSLTSINISSELAKTKVDHDRERTKEYIHQISETSNRMVQAMYDMVWSIDPKNDTMLNTIERMKSFAVEIESLFDLDIGFDIDEAAADLNLDMAHRYELLSIYKEAIYNIARHANAKHVRVCLRLKNSRFFMLIEDDGKGFDVNKAALGRGMNDMRRRAAAIRAVFYVESGKNNGTIVKVEMPV